MITLINKLPSSGQIIVVFIYFFILAIIFKISIRYIVSNVITAFILGISLILADIFIFHSYVFTFAGLIFIIGSLIRIKEFSENLKKIKIWNDFNKREKVIIIGIILVAVIIIIINKLIY